MGGGKCLVTFTPEQAITHEIEVTFNNDQVPGSPFLARVKDGDNLSFGGSSGGFAHVTVELEHLGLVAVGDPAEFTIRVPEGADAELAVSVQGPVEDIPVKVTGNVKNGFVAQFIPNAVGLHVVLVEYNGVAVGGTPFYCKVRDQRENSHNNSKSSSRLLTSAKMNIRSIDSKTSFYQVKITIDDED